MSPEPPAAFHLLAKPTGAVCNLDCAYCFFLSKEMLCPGSRFRMADEMRETYVRQLVEAHVGAPVVEVAWQGGEPTLMDLPFFRMAVELKDREDRRAGLERGSQWRRRQAGSLIDRPRHGGAAAIPGRPRPPSA